jgi:hypothetical protein
LEMKLNCLHQEVLAQTYTPQVLLYLWGLCGLIITDYDFGASFTESSIKNVVMSNIWLKSWIERNKNCFRCWIALIFHHLSIKFSDNQGSILPTQN